MYQRGGRQVGLLVSACEGGERNLEPGGRLACISLDSCLRVITRICLRVNPNLFLYIYLYKHIYIYMYIYVNIYVYRYILNGVHPRIGLYPEYISTYLSTYLSM